MSLSNSELCSIADKDEQYNRLWLEDDIQEIAQRCLGVRRWVQLRSAITILSRFGYFATNTLLEKPTPGEEFCNAQMSSGYSLMHRLLAILLNNDLRLPREVPKHIIDLVRDVHLITFYLFGDFYQLSKRVTGVSYERCDNQTVGPGDLGIVNKLAGCLSMIKLILNLSQQDRMKEMLDPVAESDKSLVVETSKTITSNVDTSMLCQLCSAQRKEPTSTLCGHIFCWACIHNWLKERNECPLCRTPTEPSRLIHLINFK